MFLKIGVCFFFFFLNAAHSFLASSAQPFFFSWESSVMCACKTILGCFHGVSGVLVWVGGEASPFPLCGQGVWAFSTPLWICSRDTSFHFDYLPDERLQQQRPVSHFVMSGNKWTSPKSTGCSCIFLFLWGSWEVRRWFFSTWRVRLQINPAFQTDGRGQTYFSCALCCLYSH